MIIINGKRLDPITDELTYKDKVIQLEPKVLAVLLALYEAKGQLVSQQTLLDSIWHNTVVAPNALQRCITQLRKHLDDDDKTLIQTFPKKGYRLCLKPQHSNLFTNRAFMFVSACFLVSLFALLLLQKLITDSSVAATTKQIRQVIPITYSKASEHSGTYGHYHYAYITDIAPQQQVLTVLNSSTQQSQVLLHAAHFYSAPAFAPQSKRLLISQQRKPLQPQLHKCSQLVLINLTTTKQQDVGNCAQPFIEKILWLSEDRVVLLASNQLSMLSLASPEQAQALQLPNDVKRLVDIQPHDASTVQLSGVNPTGEAKLWLVRIEGYTLNTLNAQSLSSSPTQTSIVKLNNKQQVHAYNNQLFFYQDSALTGQALIHSPYKIELNDVIDANTLLATQAYQDQDITERRFDDTGKYQDHFISESEFIEGDAQYQPNTHNIAFLSSRSGSSQLWITAQQPRQLTFAQPVSNFVWQQNGQALWFLSDAKLYRLTMDGQLTMLSLPVTLGQLFQHVEFEQENRYLLASQDNNNHLLKIDLNTLTVTTLLNEPVNWAQETQQNEVFFATQTGYLQRLEGHSITQESAFKDQKLQWRFYYRDSRLVVPLKDQTIWAFDPTEHSKQFLSKYDERVHLVSDIKLTPLSLLATTAGEHHANLVKIIID
ncbi:winged helix-turn-helix domain-containing protein [Pseudoalteromonas sp. T1lg23B]|uniref:winged helix-turn-helix domain-containing protein n=1 Tax=Pseudoalteromonas sp. T1lg23B TaxID=2077097 RepID=UPI000CF6622D|nr:winged helix-turn-helix domain-containing protein [Pseudoalteromonas sp. T1lg23B]